jgi:hypothetical protein
MGTTGAPSVHPQLLLPSFPRLAATTARPSPASESSLEASSGWPAGCSGQRLSLGGAVRQHLDGILTASWSVQDSSRRTPQSLTRLASQSDALPALWLTEPQQQQGWRSGSLDGLHPVVEAPTTRSLGGGKTCIWRLKAAERAWATIFKSPAGRMCPTPIPGHVSTSSANSSPARGAPQCACWVGKWMFIHRCQTVDAI